MDRENNPGPWNTVCFFPGEDQEALKSRFVDLWARYPHISVFEIARLTFQALPDAELRAGQAATAWRNDIDVLERVRIRQITGDAVDDSEIQLRKRALAIADDQNQRASDRIAALRLCGELQGIVKKSVETKSTVKAEGGAGDFLAALAAKLPT